MSKKIIKMGESELPPPGDERRDELLKRTDNLQEASEKLSDKNEVYKIDPKAVEIERELANLYDPSMLTILGVSNKQPGWAYSWANAVNQSGLQVMMKKYDGWIVVSGKDPECMEHKTADGTRRVADVLLMKLPVEKFKKLQERDALKRERQQRGVAAELEAMGRKYRHKGLKVHTPNTNSDSRGFVTQEATYDPRRAMVEKEAERQLGEQMRKEIPGLPIK